jgi:hypothetical protein
MEGLWECDVIMAEGEAAAVETALGGEVAAMVRKMCAGGGTMSEAALACPATPKDAVPATMPALPSAAVHTAPGHAAASLFRKICSPELGTLPWMCGPPRSIVDPAMCMHARASDTDPCMLTARDLYGDDLGGYQNAILALKQTNPEFYGFACEASEAPPRNHHIMCTKPLDLDPLQQLNPHAARAAQSLYDVMCASPDEQESAM